jgi:hypothetical protein
MFDLPPPIVLPERPAIVVPSAGIIRPEEYWKAMLPGMIPGAGLLGGGVLPPPTLTFLSSNIDETTDTSYSWVSQVTGLSAGSRSVALIIYGSESGSQSAPGVSAATVDGNAMTEVSAHVGVAAEEISVHCFVATFTDDNTTSTVAFTYNKEVPRAGFAIYQLDGAASITTVTEDGNEGVTSSSDMTIASFAVDPLTEIALLAGAADEMTIANWDWTVGGHTGTEDAFDMESTGCRSGIVDATSAHTLSISAGDEDAAMLIVKWANA